MKTKPEYRMIFMDISEHTTGLEAIEIATRIDFSKKFDCAYRKSHLGQEAASAYLLGYRGRV